jgi:hypothetical protein
MEILRSTERDVSVNRGIAVRPRCYLRPLAWFPKRWLAPASKLPDPSVSTWQPFRELKPICQFLPRDAGFGSTPARRRIGVESRQNFLRLK